MNAAVIQYCPVMYPLIHARASAESLRKLQDDSVGWRSKSQKTQPAHTSESVVSSEDGIQRN